MQLVIFLFVLIVNISGCPDGWTHMGSSCYRTSLEKMSWYEAKEDCQAEGGYLAELTSPEEEANINEFINHNDHFWIGLTDEDTEGKQNSIYTHIYSVYFKEHSSGRKAMRSWYIVYYIHIGSLANPTIYLV